MHSGQPFRYADGEPAGGFVVVRLQVEDDLIFGAAGELGGVLPRENSLFLVGLGKQFVQEVKVVDDVCHAPSLFGSPARLYVDPGVILPPVTAAVGSLHLIEVQISGTFGSALAFRPVSICFQGCAWSMFVFAGYEVCVWMDGGCLVFHRLSNIDWAARNLRSSSSSWLKFLTAVSAWVMMLTTRERLSWALGS